MVVDIEIVTDSRLLGEGPHWDHERQHLYYVDAVNSEIHRYVPSEKRDTFCKIASDGSFVSIIIPIKNQPEKFLVTIGKTLTIVTWDGESPQPTNIEPLTTINQPEKPNLSFNDGKVDPNGILWLGSFSFNPIKGAIDPKISYLYSFSKNRELVTHIEGITLSNGMAWSKDLKLMYYTDTATKKIDVFDYDSGKITNRRMLADLRNLEGHGPDGMAIDTNGNLWVAVFQSGKVYNINGENGKILREIDMPAMQVTSIAFGGRDLDEMYVTSGKYNVSEEKTGNEGCTFKVTGLGVKGFPGISFEI